MLIMHIGFLACFHAMDPHVGICSRAIILLKIFFSHSLRVSPPKHICSGSRESIPPDLPSFRALRAHSISSRSISESRMFSQFRKDETSRSAIVDSTSVSVEDCDDVASSL